MTNNNSSFSLPGLEKTDRGDVLFASLLSFFLVLVILSCGVTEPLAHGNIRAAILVDLDSGRVLFEKGADTPIPPASLTKVMSLFLTMDAIRDKKIKLTEKIRIPASAASVGGSTMHLRAGERVSLRELLTGAAVASGNDAITALALHVAGNQRRFVQAMNRKARTLGMRSSEFKNPSGLPAAGQRSSPRDMALLARAYLHTHPQALQYHNVRALSHRHHYLPNTNTLLGAVPGVNGLKTGWTVASGYNIIATAVRGKKRLLVVVMGGSNRQARDTMAADLLEAGFRHGSNTKQLYAALGYRAALPHHGRTLHQATGPRKEPVQTLKPLSRAAIRDKKSAAQVKPMPHKKAAPARQGSKPRGKKDSNQQSLKHR